MNIETSLRVREKQFKTIIESILDYAILMLDLEGNIASWNKGAELIKGYHSEEIIGRHFSVFYPQQDILNGKPDFELEIAAAEGRFEDEGWRVRKDGSLFWANVIITALRDQSGTLTGYAKITRDITDRRKADENLRQLNIRLEQYVAKLNATNSELESFCYSVSHDLRAPLRSIDGFSQAVIEDYADRLDDQGRDYLGRVRAATQHMGQLIDDMLTLSRVTRAEMRRGTVDLSALAADVFEELRRNEPQRSVAWRIEPGLVAEGDSQLLRVVVVNLLGNAWKFTGKTADARIEFGALAGANGTPELFVRDNGAGFDMNYAGKLFGAFQRLHLSGEFPGTGVGLATVQRIIHRHGGQVRGEGIPGQGATFYFTLPGISFMPAHPAPEEITDGPVETKDHSAD